MNEWDSPEEDDKSCGGDDVSFSDDPPPTAFSLLSWRFMIFLLALSPLPTVLMAMDHEEEMAADDMMVTSYDM